MRLRIMLQLVACLCLLSLLGCATRAQTVSQKSVVPDAELVERLAGKIWVAEYIHGRPVIDMSHSSMVFTTEGRVSGRGGCNVFSGSYTLKGGKLLFGPLATTMKMCASAISKQEARFFESMEAAQVVTFGNGLLQLTPDKGKPSVFAEQKMD